jgi:hypothetical protein
MASVVLAGLMLVAANGVKAAEKMAAADSPVAVSGKDGKPGTTKAPLATPGRAIEALCLSGADWRIHDDADGKGDQRGMPLADPAAADWTPATVPGNIQADLEAAHQLKPLWYGAGDPRMADVPKKDWWYRNDFDVPASFAGQRLTLVFDGVDHECDVWVNGKRIGRNAGMFRRFWFDVTQAIEPGRRNRLAVRIARMPESLAAAIAHADDQAGANVQKCTAAFLKELKELKSPTNSGWDWGVPMYTLGIWKDVRLEPTGPVRIDWVRVETPLSDNYQKAKVKVGLEVDSQIEGPARAMFRVRRFVAGTNGTLETCPPMSVDTVLKKGTNLIRADLTLDQPALWWPNGQGEQPLYEVEAVLTIPDEGGKLETRHADRRVTRFGVREIRWEQCPGAPANFINPFRLVVNGRPVRQMGSNLIPPDLLFGRMDQRGLRLLELAHRADINCLRVWGWGRDLLRGDVRPRRRTGHPVAQRIPARQCRTGTRSGLSGQFRVHDHQHHQADAEPSQHRGVDRRERGTLVAIPIPLPGARPAPPSTANNGAVGPRTGRSHLPVDGVCPRLRPTCTLHLRVPHAARAIPDLVGGRKAKPLPAVRHES